MRGPFDLEQPSVRGRAKAAAKQAYPVGRAMGRIELFEVQRNLPRTTVQDGCVVSETAGKAKMLKRAARVRRPSAASPYALANQARAALVPDFEHSVNLPVWRALGPRLVPHGQTYGTGGNNMPPVSGRCVGVFISPTDPQRLVACSAGGGLWGSADGGGEWCALTDAQPTLSMGAIRHAPGSPNLVYAGTGEGDTFSQLGVGLLRSSDGGLHWELLEAPELAGAGVYDIEVDPGEPLHLWVGTTQKLLESRDGGVSWRVVQRLTSWDISINPNDPSEILVATAAGLIRSTNGGSTWALVPLPGVAAGARFQRLEVCHAPSRPSVAYVAGVVDGAGLFCRRASTNGSFTSQRLPRLQANSDIAQSWYDWCMAVAPDDHELVYWGAVHLYRGRRGSTGFSWQNISSRASGDSIHPDQHHIAFDPSDPAVVYICNDGGIFRSPNRGQNWESLNPGLGITEFEYITQLENRDHWLIGGTQDNGTLSLDAGTTWDQIALGDGGDCGVDDPGELCYHSYYGMWIERAAALGSNAFDWVDVSPPFSSSYSALFYPPLEVNGPLVAKAGVTLFISEDQGNNWDEISFAGAGEKASALAIVGSDTVLLGTESGSLFRIRRHASGWANASITELTTPRPNAYISDIAVPVGATGVIWVTSSAFGGPHVFRSSNGGHAWSDRSGNLPDIPINAIAVDPQNRDQVFVGSDHGVYRSQDAGQTWGDFSNGLPTVVVGDAIIHARRRLLRIGTRSRGIWEVPIDA